MCVPPPPSIYRSFDPPCGQVTVFKNQGAQAGASLMHPHGQVGAAL